MGRPSEYSAEIANEICSRLMSGESLRKICADESQPVIQTVFNWLQAHPEFMEQYRRAREVQAEVLADELKDISDEEPTCLIQTKNGGYEAVDKGGVERNKLRVNTRQWIAARLLPKKYGDKLAVEHDVSDSLAERIAKARAAK